MLKKIKEICLSLGVFSLLAIPVAVPAMVSADIASQLCAGSNAGTSTSNVVDINSTSTDTSGCADSSGNGSSIQRILRLVINVFSIVVGFVAVIMIIVGGIKYITSGGDSGNISGAKNTIVYAIIGLVIVALAQVIVHFVLNQATNALSQS